MKNPDEAIEHYQLAKKDRERLERMRHIGRRMPGPLTCDDGTRWHPTEILALVEDVERLRDVRRQECRIQGMTFDEWWEDFVAEHEEWKYADSAALRRAAFQAGAASRDAEVVSLTNQRDYEYVRAENAEQERDQFEQVRDQLRAHINKLRECLMMLMLPVPHEDETALSVAKAVSAIAEEALAATPEQSLAEYRNKVIEQMIACYSPDDSAHDYFDKLNAMKEPE